jgi:GNAT superfamily N-acetyltransferase
MLIRDFAAGDADACARILTVASGVVEAGWPPIDIPEFHRVTEAEEILVAERGGHVLGFLSCYRPDRFIHHLYVDPAHWRQGIGRALLAAAEVRLDGGAKLKCRQADLGARAFYRSQGWDEHPGGRDDRGPWLWLKQNGRQG